MKRLHLMVSAAIAVCLLGHAMADVPRLMNYQGRLLDSGGLPLSTNVTMAVGIYTQAMGGAAAYMEVVGSVAVNNGLYSFHFGADTPALVAALGGEEVWLEVVVNGSPLTPRQRLVAVPYAILSERVEHIGSTTTFAAGIVDSDAIADGAVTSNKLAGNAYTEIDPVFADSVAARITVADTSNWYQAMYAVQSITNLDLLFDIVDETHGWGNHATNGYATEAYVDNATNSLYAVLSTEIDTDVGALSNSLKGVAFTGEVDPRWSAVSNAVTTQAAHGETAYGWGDHAGAVATLRADLDQEVLDREDDVDTEQAAREAADATLTADIATRLVSNVWAAADSTTNYVPRTGGAMSGDLDMGGNRVTNATYYGNGAGLTNVTAASFAEGDPVYGGAPAALITDAGSGAVITGDERAKLNGVETDADVTDAANVEAAGAVMDGDIGVAVQAHSAHLDDLADGTLSKTKVQDSANWDTAHGWGNHATNDYLTTEVDPNAVLANGSRAMSGDLNMGGNSITNIATNSLVFADGTSIAASNVVQWNAAYGWGDHAASNAALQAAIDQEIADRIADVDTEETARLAADGTLTTNLNQEIADRVDDVDAEEAARTAGDAVLTTNLNAEIANRIADVEAEQAAREAADATLTADIATRLVSNVWAAADSTTNYLPRTGGRMSGDLDIGGNRVTNATYYGNGVGLTNVTAASYSEDDPVWTATSNSYLKSAVAASTYVAVSGGTMTGKLVLPANGLVVGSTQLVVTNGNVGIGTANPTNELAVNGTIKAKEVVVTLDGWADDVFEDGYPLMPLEQVQQYIDTNGHLPDVPSARQVAEGGVKMGEMQATLLRKVEELTLHMIEIKRENAVLHKRVAELEWASVQHSGRTSRTCR